MLTGYDAWRAAFQDSSHTPALGRRHEVDMDLKTHDALTYQVIGMAIEVHRCLGPGLQEGTYEEAVCIELVDARVPFTRQPRIDVTYKGRKVGQYRPDLVIASQLVVEVKSVDRLIGLHQAQLLAYMRVLKVPTGLLLNFNGEVLRTGVKRLVLNVTP